MFKEKSPFPCTKDTTFILVAFTWCIWYSFWIFIQNIILEIFISNPIDDIICQSLPLSCSHFFPVRWEDCFWSTVNLLRSCVLCLFPRHFSIGTPWFWPRQFTSLVQFPIIKLINSTLFYPNSLKFCLMIG